MIYRTIIFLLLSIYAGIISCCADDWKNFDLDEHRNAWLEYINKISPSHQLIRLLTEYRSCSQKDKYICAAKVLTLIHQDTFAQQAQSAANAVPNCDAELLRCHKNKEYCKKLKIRAAIVRDLTTNPQRLLAELKNTVQTADNWRNMGDLCSIL